MATTTQLALPARTASPFALWHLLSLDAPTVAALWTWFIARAAHIRLSLATPGAMAVTVWIIYAADRLLDARLLDALHSAPSNELEARHHFHHRHRRAFLTGITLAAAALAALLPHLNHAAIRLYLIEGTLLGAWFLAIHATRSAHRLPKEIAVGLFFSAAVFIPTIVQAPTTRLVLLPSAVLFAVLCSLNCLFIYAWEHRPSARLRYAATRFAHLPTLAVAIAITATTLTVLTHPNRIPAACAIAASILLALHYNRSRLTRIHLRAAADLALLTPALFLPFLR